MRKKWHFPSRTVSGAKHSLEGNRWLTQAKQSSSCCVSQRKNNKIWRFHSSAIYRDKKSNCKSKKLVSFLPISLKFFFFQTNEFETNLVLIFYDFVLFRIMLLASIISLLGNGLRISYLFLYTCPRLCFSGSWVIFQEKIHLPVYNNGSEE